MSGRDVGEKIRARQTAGRCFGVDPAEWRRRGGPAGQPARPGLTSRFETLSAVKDSTAGVFGQLSAEIVRTTPGFVNAAAINDMYEVAAGKIALQRSRSPAVRAFARQMIDAHTASTATAEKDHSQQQRQRHRAGPRRCPPPGHAERSARRQAAIISTTAIIAQQIAAHKEARHPDAPLCQESARSSGCGTLPPTPPRLSRRIWPWRATWIPPPAAPPAASSPRSARRQFWMLAPRQVRRHFRHGDFQGRPHMTFDQMTAAG